MWDIKIGNVRTEDYDFSVFHLNHVGYKGGDPAILATTLCSFHLNHVGYKARIDASVNRAGGEAFI